MDRLFELLVIQLLRHVLEKRIVNRGMLAGLADPRLARALHVIHHQPGDAWTVESLANTANMSRANFAAQFREVIGQSPADYLLDWRIGLAQKRLRDGQPIARVADEVGYDSASALARAFRRKTGASPRDWLRAQMHAVTMLPPPARDAGAAAACTSRLRGARGCLGPSASAPTQSRMARYG